MITKYTSFAQNWKLLNSVQINFQISDSFKERILLYINQ